MALLNNIKTATAGGGAQVLYTVPIGAEAAMSTLFFNAVSGTAQLTLQVYKQADGILTTVLEDFPVNDDAPYNFPKPIMLEEGDYVQFSAASNNIVGLAGFYEEGGAVTAEGVLNPRGAYSGAATYDRLDVAEDAGTSYICLTDSTTGDAPPSVNWMILAEKGDPGGGTIATQDADAVAITGGDIGGVTLGSYSETLVTLTGTTPDIDLTLGTVFSLTTSGNTTFTISGQSATDASGFTLVVEAGGTHTLTWPASFDWGVSGTPTAPASGESITVTGFTIDNGTSYRVAPAWASA